MLGLTPVLFVVTLQEARLLGVSRQNARAVMRGSAVTDKVAWMLTFIAVLRWLAWDRPSISCDRWLPA